MSNIFSDFFDALQDLFDEVMSAINDLIAKIKEYLPYILIILAICFGLGFTYVLYGVTLTGWTAAALTMGASYLLLPDETAAAVAEVGAVVSDAAVDIIEAVSPVVDALGSAVGGAAASLLGPVAIPLLIGLGLWLYFKDDKEDDAIIYERPRDSGGQR